jgi:methyl-accepting chemotaxis protein
MFKNMKIGIRLGLGFGLVLLLLSVIAFIGVTRLAEMNGSIEKIVKDRYPKVQKAYELEGLVSENARAIRNIVLLTDDEGMKREKDRVDNNRKKIAEIFAWFDKNINTEEGRKIIKSMDDARLRYVQPTDKVIQLGLQNKTEESTKILMGEVRPLQTAYLNAIHDMIVFQSGTMDKAATAADETYNTARSLMMILGIAAAVLGVGIAFLVTRSITKPLNEAVGVANQLADGDMTAKIEVDSKDETGQLLQAMKTMVGKLSQIIGEVRGSADALSSASEEVSATAQSISQATSEQAASVEETSASIEQMSASINQNTDNAKVTDGMSSQAAKQANEGGQAVKDTVAAMKSIAGKIGIIDDIAYQTNLLALNAAIEAARAGEHGKGFAVVAAEVRKLAERSQVAAQEISELASGSVDKAETAGKLLDVMVPSITKTSDLVQEIAAASAEQSSGVGQINTAMEQLNQITQQNASASEELAATAEEMSGQAMQLQEIMAFFKVDANAMPATQAFATTKVTPKKIASTQSQQKAAPAETGFVKF